jgi:Ca2+:H+ antiporter
MSRVGESVGPPEADAKPGRLSAWRKLDALVLALPVAVVVERVQAPPGLVFLVSALAVIPLAGLIGRATEVLAERVGGSVGALLNATFGTAAEVIIGAFLVLDGHIEVLKASLTGSIIANLLLLLGVSMIVSSHDRHDVEIARAARGQATMLFLTVGIFLLPTVFSFRAESSSTRVDEVSDAIALVLVVIYALALLFMLRTHRSLFRREPNSPEGAGEAEPPAADQSASWSPKRAVAVLAIATVLVSVAAEIVAGSIQAAGSSLGLGSGFLGFIVLPLVGNAAEQFSALSLAAKDRLDVAADIAISASLQVLMLVVPLMVLIGLVVGHHVTLVFSVLELTVLATSTLLTRQVVDDQRGNWMEGVMLLGLYAAFAVAAFFVTV